MYICNKFGNFLLLICLMLIRLFHPEEFRRVEGNLFFLSYIINSIIVNGSVCLDVCVRACVCSVGVDRENGYRANF